MARFSGTIRRSDLEGGLLQLEADGGTIYELEGDVDDKWVGKAVVVEGSVDKNVMSFTMTGPRLVVKSIAAGK
ncbi:MAG: DUF5818 domain-containing protein [Deltaproteobacteria bacterium]|nr:DUF5818 domain-containing protein [Deltaproteobacteria bacterium]